MLPHPVLSFTKYPPPLRPNSRAPVLCTIASASPPEQRLSGDHGPGTAVARARPCRSPATPCVVLNVRRSCEGVPRVRAGDGVSRAVPDLCPRITALCVGVRAGSRVALDVMAGAVPNADALRVGAPARPGQTALLLGPGAVLVPGLTASLQGPAGGPIPCPSNSHSMPSQSPPPPCLASQCPPPPPTQKKSRQGLTQLRGKG